MQIARGRIGPDGAGFLQQYRTGIETFIHFHDGDAGFRIARHNRPLDRRRPAPARQERDMNIDATLFGSFQHRCGQDQPIGDHHGDIGAQLREFRLCVHVLQRFGMADGQAERLGPRMHGRRTRLVAPPGRSRRLGIDTENFVPRPGQRLKRGHGDIGRPHEDDLHRRGVSLRPPSSAFSSCA